MLTKMTDADWITVLRVFEASRSRRGDKARDDKNSYQQCAEQFGRGRKPFSRLQAGEAQAENPAFRCTSNSKQPLNGI